MNHLKSKKYYDRKAFRRIQSGRLFVFLGDKYKIKNNIDIVSKYIYNINTDTESE